MAWNEQRNAELAVKAWNIAQQIRQLGLDSYVVLKTWEANGVATDPAFVDARGVAKDDIVGMIGILADYVAFLQNGAVPTEQRDLVLARILGGSVQG